MRTLVLILLLIFSNTSRGDAISLQYMALAPNAGGQINYAIKYFSSNYEVSFFSSQYLTAHGHPLTGISLGHRFNVCEKNCWVQGFIQPGFGLTQLSPHVDLTWGTILGWTVRLDLTTQLYLNTHRIYTWSYPVWAGITIPF